MTLLETFQYFILDAVAIFSLLRVTSLSEENCILTRPPGRNVSAALFEVKSNRLELK